VTGAISVVPVVYDWDGNHQAHPYIRLKIQTFFSDSDPDSYSNNIRSITIHIVPDSINTGHAETYGDSTSIYKSGVEIRDNSWHHGGVHVKYDGSSYPGAIMRLQRSKWD